jgi:hypothetical protein
MKAKAIMYFMLPLLIFTGCSKQEQNGKALNRQTRKREYAQGDTVHRPDVSVKVNKQYDDKGRLIRYDSAYSYKYVGPGIHIQDSILERFRSRILHPFPEMTHPRFDNIYFEDFFPGPSPFEPPFFRGPSLNNRVWENMYRRLDSLKRSIRQQEDIPHNKTG